MPSKQLPIPVEQIGKPIFLIRGHKVMLDADLAELYGVTTKRLNEQVRLREMMATQKELAFKLAELEERLEGHDEQIQNIFEAIRQLMIPPETARKKIRFVNEPAARYGKGKSRGSTKQICNGNI